MENQRDAVFRDNRKPEDLMVPSYYHAYDTQRSNRNQ